MFQCEVIMASPISDKKDLSNHQEQATEHPLDPETVLTVNLPKLPD